MFTQSELSILASYTMQDGEQARLYPIFPVGNGLYADAALVTDKEMIGFMNFKDPNYDDTKLFDEACTSAASMFDGTYASTDWRLTNRHGWGSFVFWNDHMQIGTGALKRKPKLWAQLSVLWKDELRSILRELGLPDAPEGASKAELIAAIAGSKLTTRKERAIAGLVRRALMNRDYHALGRGDFTYWQHGTETDLIFGWQSPDSHEMLVKPDAWIDELWDDPADRHPPLADMAAGEIEKAAQKKARLLVTDWKKRGIRLAPGTQRRLAVSLQHEMEGTEEPERSKTYAEDQARDAESESTENRPQGWVTWDKIRAVPGVPWISEEIIESFARFIAGGKNAEDHPSIWYQGVMRDEQTGKWAVRYSQPSVWTTVDYARLESTFGVPGYNGLRILDALLNLRQPNLEDEERTLAVLEKQDLILEVFDKWLWQNPKRRREVEESYNAVFSQFNIPAPSGKDLTFPGMSDAIQLFDYQKDAVAKILSEDNTLLAFDTGAGKTYIMIAAAMKLRQSGESRKNMFVVPNNIVGQWEQMFLQMYPDAKLLVIDPARFKPDVRESVLRSMKTGDFDGIIIAYSCLEQIPLSKTWINRHKRKETEKLGLKSDQKEYNLRGFTSLKRGVQHAKDALAAEAKKLTALVDKVPPRSVKFDQLGVTGLFLDEAHNYKNVPVRSALGAIGGLNPTGSVKCLAMMNKVRCVQEYSDGRGAVLATATPLSNSLADAFVMQQYVQPEQLQKTSLHTFDNWVKSFARPEYVCEIDVDTSRFRYVKRLARFYNIPELSRMFSSSTSFYAMDESDGLPDLAGYTNVLIDRGEGLKDFMDELVRRTERIRNHEVPREVDNMLKVSTEGRLAALDLRLVGGEQPYDEHSKIHACVEQVLSIYNGYEGCTQIVFCDYSTPKADAFNVYDDLRKHLVASGVPDKEIAFIHSFTTEAKKLELYRKVNNGEVRILIGSTFKLGIGTNVQTLLKAIHHLDIPWRPADMVQREGRILRQGNMNDTIKICRYISEGSFDAYSWQILERKQAFISQFLSGTAYERSASDLEDIVLTYAQVKSLAISEPLMKDLAEKENELRRLRMLASNFVQTNVEREETLDKKRQQREILRQQTEATQLNAEYAAGIEEDAFKTTLTEYKDLLTPEFLGGSRTLTPEQSDLLGFAFSLQPDEKKPNIVYAVLERAGAQYRVRLGDSANGNVRRIVNFVRRLDAEHTRLNDRLNDLTAQITGAETALEESNPYPAQIETLREEIGDLRSKIMERQGASEMAYA